MEDKWCPPRGLSYELKWNRELQVFDLVRYTNNNGHIDLGGYPTAGQCYDIIVKDMAQLPKNTA